MAPSKKTLSKSANQPAGKAGKQTKGKSVKMVKPARPSGGKSLPKTSRPGVTKKIVAKKSRPGVIAKKNVSRPSVTKTSPKKSGKAVVKAKKVVAKSKPSPVKKNKVAVKSVSKASPKKSIKAKASRPGVTVKSATKTKAVKKVNNPTKQKSKVAVAKKGIDLKKAGEKNTKLKAKTRLSEVKAKINPELPVVAQIDIHGEDLHFIPEHNAITHPLTPREAHEKEIVFHNKEEVTFHQANQKVKNALPSRKTMKVFFRKRGGGK